jgi:hypothetical protein
MAMNQLAINMFIQEELLIEILKKIPPITISIMKLINYMEHRATSPMCLMCSSS